jgi:hypothetical protein
MIAKAREDEKSESQSLGTSMKKQIGTEKHDGIVWIADNKQQEMNC